MSSSNRFNEDYDSLQVPKSRKTWMRRMERAKMKHRPSLKNWAKDGFCTSRLNDFLCLKGTSTLTNQEHNNIFNELQKNTQMNLNFSQNQSGSVARVTIQNLSVESFRDMYETTGIPCIITDIPYVEKWDAVCNWDFNKLNMFKDRYFKVGEDDKGKTDEYIQEYQLNKYVINTGYSVKVRLKYFLKYLSQNRDDSPLYIFDSHFDEDSISKILLQDYRVPSIFPEDFFHLVGEKRRPPYRWFLMGPERSGTCVHIDPLGTSAWNTVIQGRKRWVLMPPDTPRRLAKAKDVILPGEDDEAVNYFIDLIPRLRAKHPELRILEFIQYPGETVFVPGGWWHAVINLDDTIAITQNYCSRVNFDRVWRSTRTGRKKMAVNWLRKLATHHPDLAQRALRLNAEDGFQMKNLDGFSSLHLSQQVNPHQLEYGRNIHSEDTHEGASHSPTTSRDSNCISKPLVHSTTPADTRESSDRRRDRRGGKRSRSRSRSRSKCRARSRSWSPEHRKILRS